MNVVGFLRCACPLDRFEALGVAHTLWLCGIVRGFNGNVMTWCVRQGKSSGLAIVRERGSEKKKKMERKRCEGLWGIKGNFLTPWFPQGCTISGQDDEVQVGVPPMKIHRDFGCMKCIVA